MDEIHATAWDALRLVLDSKKRQREQVDAWIKRHLESRELSLNGSSLEWTDGVDWQDLVDLICPHWRELA